MDIVSGQGKRKTKEFRLTIWKLAYYLYHEKHKDLSSKGVWKSQDIGDSQLTSLLVIIIP